MKKEVASLFTAAYLTCLSTHALACDGTIDQKWVDRFRSLTASEICGKVATELSAKTVRCTSGSIDKEEVEVEVVKGFDRDLIQFDVKMVAKSSMLTDVLGEKGFESHKYKLLMFLDLNCRTNIWAYAYEPRKIRASYHIASNADNPNWRLFNDNNRIVELSDRFRSWIRESLTNEK